MTSTELFKRKKYRSGTLKPHEIEIIKHLADGLVIKEVAHKMNRPHKSIAWSLEVIRSVMEVKNNPHMIAVAIREGII